MFWRFNKHTLLYCFNTVILFYFYDWLLKVFLITISWSGRWIPPVPLNMLSCQFLEGDAFPLHQMGSLSLALQHNLDMVLEQVPASQSHSCYNPPKKVNINLNLKSLQVLYQSEIVQGLSRRCKYLKVDFYL